MKQCKEKDNGEEKKKYTHTETQVKSIQMK